MGNIRKLYILLIIASLDFSFGAKILSISFVSSKSHYITYEPLLLELAERGHEVTIVNSVRNSREVKNVRRIYTYEMDTLFNSPKTFQAKESSSEFWKHFSVPYVTYSPIFEELCIKTYKMEEIQKLRKEKFDLIIFPPLWNDCVYGLIHELNTSVVLYNQMAIMPWVSASLGSPSLPSFVPMIYYNYPDEMTFFQRAGNFFGLVLFNLVRTLYFEPKMEKVYREGLGNPNLPSIKEIEGNASLALVNSHINFVPPRPVSPDIIEVGGLYLRDAKPLPQDLQDFCDGAGDEGVILLSFGSILKVSAMPPKVRQVFINVFSKLKQRIIWKWEIDEVPKDMPSNVKLSKWLPQPDILLHKNTRLFITHGGHGSTSESLYAGVPMVGVPMFGEQQWNIEQAVAKGYAVSLNFAEITEELLYDAINTVLYKPEYSQKANFAAQLYRDQMESPLERAVYWVEYVLRYDGAPHLKSAGRKLNFFQYYSLDVIAFFAGILGLVLILVVVAIRTALRIVFGTGKKTDQKKKRQ